MKKLSTYINESLNEASKAKHAISTGIDFDAIYDKPYNEKDFKKSLAKHQNTVTSFVNNKDFEKWQKAIASTKGFKALYDLGYFVYVFKEKMHGDSVIIDIKKIPVDLTWLWSTDARILFHSSLQLRDAKLEGDQDFKKAAEQMIKDLKKLDIPKEYE